jgi:hypothetical protein
VQRTGERDVVDVVAGGMRERAFLAPSGHAAVDEPGIALEALVGAKPEALGHAGAKSFDEGVGPLDHPQHRLDRFGALEIERDRAAAAIEQVEFGAGRDSQARVGGAVDPHHVGAHVGKQHRAHRAGTDSGQFDYAVARQYSHDSPLVGSGDEIGAPRWFRFLRQYFMHRPRLRTARC